jgi:hypothetical protein
MHVEKWDGGGVDWLHVPIECMYWVALLSAQTAGNAVYRNNWFVFVAENGYVYCGTVGPESLNTVQVNLSHYKVNSAVDTYYLTLVEFTSSVLHKVV